MLIRVGDQFINTDDIFYVEFVQDDELCALVTIRRDGESKDLKIRGGAAEYMQTILDAQHVISVQHIRDSLPNLT